MPVNQDRVNEVAQDLQGTCKSLDDFTTEEEASDVEFCRALDDLVFCCQTCGWWYEIAELSEDEELSVCNDCYMDY